jgi:transcriptional regulator with XRE-family HTH domain
VGFDGSRLRALREKRGYSQQDLAEKIDASLQQIWRWEQNKNDPTGDFITRLAQALDTTADFLLGLDDDPTGRRREEDLTPDEMRLLAAYRAGRVYELLRLLGESDPSQVNQQPNIASSEPAVKG